MYQLKIITSTVRPSRKGPIVTDWIAQKARQHKSFFTEFIKDGKLMPNEIMEKAAETMLRELERWTKRMKAIREEG